MNKGYTYNQQTYKIIYVRYKKFLVPIVTICVSLAAFYFLVMPQIQDVQNAQSVLSDKQQKAHILDQNIVMLNGIDENKLTDQVQAEVTALPPDKDFAGMLSAVTGAAGPANVKLSDFGFSVGDLSTESAKLSDQLAIQMNLSVDGGIDGARRYIKELSQRLPLNEIITEQTSADQSSIQVSFFYHPFAPQSNDGSTAIQPISSDAEQQASMFKEWINNAKQSQIATQSASK